MVESIDESVAEGVVYDLKVAAKGTRGEGIGRIGNLVVFIRNARTRIGNIYKVRVTKVYRTFAYAELHNSAKQFIGGGSLIDLG